MKSNIIEIDFSEYNDAIEKSLYDQDWIKNLYNDKENIVEFFKDINPSRYIEFAANFIRNPDFRKVIKAKTDQRLNNRFVERILNAGTAEENLNIVNKIQSHTKYYATITENLMHEYSENTRNFLSGTIKPFPEKIEDTWKPIKSFKLITDEFNVVLKLKTNQITCESENEDINNYFIKRNACKDIKRGFLKENQISENSFNKTKRELLNLKQIEIPTNYCLLEKIDSKYKISYRGNQTVKINNEEYSISGSNIKIYQILEVQ
jgi:hypothetical protein